jgi:hypothetical protein
MEVSINSLRERLVSDFNSLTKKLNESVKDVSRDPEINIDPESIRNEMNNIRFGLITLYFSYIEGNGEFKSMDDDVDFEEFFNPPNLSI